MLSTQLLAERLLPLRSLLLTTHSGPDGDGLGCMAAMADAWSRAGRSVLCVLPEEMPAKYRFLDPEGRFRPLETTRREVEATDFDLALVLDTHQRNMFPDLSEILLSRKIPTVFLDHHPAEDAARNQVHGSADAVATGVLVYDLIVHHLAWPLSPAAAEALYVSISFDTNSFKYIRSNPESLLIGADLLRRGVDSTRVYRNLFGSNPLRKARLIGHLLSSVKFVFDGRLAYALVPHALVESWQLDRDDLRDGVNHLLEIEGVEIAATLKETDPGQVKVSLRSKGSYAINGVCAHFGGGGHALAAGCEISGTLDEAWQRLEAPLSALLSAPAAER